MNRRWAAWTASAFLMICGVGDYQHIADDCSTEQNEFFEQPIRPLAAIIG